MFSLQLAGNREQVEYAETSSKRIRLEELDAVPSKLKSLAEKTRNQRSYLRKEYRSLEKLCDQLSDPALMTKLPFPFPGKGKQTDRFTILDDDSWSYLGREYFTTLLNKVTELMGSATGEISLYGTIGFGKTHLLAALVCYLSVAGKRVVYFPDCRDGPPPAGSLFRRPHHK